jgi:polyisoprenoid-binding protein YceI
MASPQDLTALTGSWTLDPARTTVEFTTKAMWVLPVRATVTAVEGAGLVGDDGSVTGTLVLDAASIDTKNKKRDAHLQTEEFFEVATYPTFVVNVFGATPTSSGAYDFDASLTVRGQERPVKFTGPVSIDSGVATVKVETDIDRSEWGVSWAKLGAGLKNHVVVTARFTKD